MNPDQATGRSKASDQPVVRAAPADAIPPKRPARNPAADRYIQSRLKQFSVR